MTTVPFREGAFLTAPLAPAPTYDPFNSPVGRFLLHPDQTLDEWAHELWDLVWSSVLPVALIAAAVVAGALLVRTVLRRRQATSGVTGARSLTILVPSDVERAGGETLWANLVELLHSSWRRLLEGQPHLSFELAWSVEGLQISMWVPRQVPPGLVERAIEAAWPGARTEVAEPSPPLPADAPALGGELRLASPEWFPLRTSHDVDPLRALLGAAGDLGEGEWAAVQVLARPVTARRLARCHQAAKALRTGMSPTRGGRLLDLVTPGPVAASRPADDPTRARDIRAILDKAAGPGWEVVVRYGVATSEEGHEARRHLRGRAHALASGFGAFSGRNRLSRHRLRHPAAVLAARRMGGGDLMSVPELAALAHLPADQTVAGLRRAAARPVAPPPGIPTAGKVLGDADAGSRRQVALAPPDARYHVHLMGATGTGKSTLLANLVLSDVAAGRGAVVVDPKGDLVVDILDRLPAEAADRVVLLDPDDETPPTLNVLAGTDADLVVDHVVGIFRRIFEAYWGPRTDDVLRAACLTLKAGGNDAATLAEVPLLLGDARYRARYTAGLTDPVGLGGFWAWYDALSEAQQAQVVGPVMNKLRAFLLRGFVRTVVGRPDSSFDMATDVLDGGLLLVRVPKGILGDETSKLLGSLVVARVWQAAMARARAGEQARVDAALYVDECQNFLHLPRSFEEMLAEARGYRLSFVLAHQHLTQLPRDLRDAISANARNKVLFTISPEDAHALARHVGPVLGEHDLARLGGYQAVARLVVGGADQPAFTLKTRPAPPAIPGRARLVRRRSAERFGAEADPRGLAGASNVIDRRLRQSGARGSGAGSGAGSPAGSGAGS